MPLNDSIKKEGFEEFTSNKYLSTTKTVAKRTPEGSLKNQKVEFSIVAGGSIGRKLLRRIAKAELKKNKGKLESPLGKMRSRQERKAMAKSLKIPFTPRYNGEVTKMEWELVPNKKNEKYTQLVLGVK